MVFRKGMQNVTLKTVRGPLWKSTNVEPAMKKSLRYQEERAFKGGVWANHQTQEGKGWLTKRRYDKRGGGRKKRIREESYS